MAQYGYLFFLHQSIFIAEFWKISLLFVNLKHYNSMNKLFKK